MKEGHLSETNPNSSTGLKPDRKSVVYNSLIHHKLMVPHARTDSYQPEEKSGDSKLDNEAAKDDQQEDEFQNVLKILKAQEDIQDESDRNCG